MSGKICLLPDDITNKIAAGEVIERPASILKELLENSLDAGATDITVELERGGCSAIGVRDNGEGMDREDAALAFSRFATSKIYHFDDIYRVHSFGFRGEALPSIASIARVEMTTKGQTTLGGTKVIVEAGEIREITETGCPAGTSLSITDIFGSVPVRRKFLKSEHTEQGHCVDVISRLALANPGLRLKVFNNGREILSIPAVDDTGQRLALVMGTDFLDQMVPLAREKGGLGIHGFASRPSLTRANSRHMYAFVNGRFIRDQTIHNAVMTAYRHIIEAKRYPAVVLFMDVPPGDVDVNVHPAKLEVRFRDAREVYHLVAEAVADALGGPIPAGPPRETGGLATACSSADSGHGRGVEEALKRYTLSLPPQESSFSHPLFRRLPSFRTTALPEFRKKGSGDETASTWEDLSYLGKVGGTYLVFAGPEGLMIMDQHAAHERVLFEKLKRQSRRTEGPPPSQGLLIPAMINLSPGDYAFLMECLPLLADSGFTIEPFGHDTVAVKAVPLVVSTRDPKEIIGDFLEEFTESGDASFEARKEKMYTFLACRGAVKARQDIGPEEVAALCRDLAEVSHQASCPHGRPVTVSFSFSELEKMFKRR